MSAPRQRPVIGITGGIGAGKSVVARMLGELGCLVADSDALARAALEDPAVRREIVAWWGPDVLDDDGRVDRAAVGRIVFTDPAQRRRLEGLTHPWIEARRRELFAAAGAEVRAFVIDAPLLLEAGLDGDCDAVIFVEADRAIRLARVRSTRGWSEEELDRREESQWPLDRKRDKADYVVWNEGDLSDLKAQLCDVLGRIIGSNALETGSDAGT